MSIAPTLTEVDRTAALSVWAVPGLDFLPSSTLLGEPRPVPAVGDSGGAETTHSAHSAHSATETAETAAIAELTVAFAARRAVDVRIAAASVVVGVLMRSARGRDSNNAESESCGTDAEAAASRYFTFNRNTAELLVEVGRISNAEAKRFVRVGAATNRATSFSGDPIEVDFPTVSSAFVDGILPLESTDGILTALAKASPRAEAHHLVEADRVLTEFATYSSSDTVRQYADRWRDALDVDGIEPREEQLIKMLSLRRYLRANGMKRYVIDADPVSSAYLDAAIDSHVGAEIRRPTFFEVPDGRAPDSALALDTDNIVRRPIEQLSAEAIIDIVRHGISCTSTEIPIRATTVVVRMTLESLVSGIGVATIDGIEQPISASNARKMAADAEIIPMVLGSQNEVLDLGRRARLFSRAQKLAMADRDGGCAVSNCQKPPSHTEAHHVKWWSRGGRSDLMNGVMLCSPHHHEIHNNHWQIVMKDAVPWFIPPHQIDPRRRPRRGGRPLEPTLPTQP